MTLRNSLFAVSGKASFLDARRDMSGLFVCDKTTMMPIAGILDRSQDNLVTGNSNSMSVTVHPFNAVLNRYGALLIQNDGNVSVPLNAAPSANSRIDVVYVKQNETRSPMSDSSDVPEFGVVKGTASAVPVAPAVPAGALALAEVLLPAGVSNTAASGVVIAQTYIGAAMKGDMLRVQTSAQRDALTDVPEGTLLHNVADNCDYVRTTSGKWAKTRDTIDVSIPFTTNRVRLSREWDTVIVSGSVHYTGSNQCNHATANETIPTGWRPYGDNSAANNYGTIGAVNANWCNFVRPDGVIIMLGNTNAVYSGVTGGWQCREWRA
nr:MAG TPA: protein of unknown function (DUF4815) [Caudoviricetes sp.]